MKTIYKPDYRKAENAAYSLLKNADISELPIKVKEIAHKFPNLKVRSYSWFANKRGMTRDQVIELTDSDEGCCWYKKSTNQYLILYNDNQRTISYERMRWTIAHELGHYMLRHNELNSNKTIIARSSLSSQEYEAFELEANCFARTLLAPPQILSSIGHLTANDVSSICSISFEAANKVVNFINRGRKMGVKYGRLWIVNKFSSFILKIKNTNYCTNCDAKFIATNPFFCSVCGSNDISRSIDFWGVDVGMKYSGYEVDENGRALVCPKCENEELNYEGDFCDTCGTLIVNKCADTRRISETGLSYTEDSCETTLNGHARYCIKCGNESTFYQQGLLKSWESEKNKANEDPFDDPFAAVSSANIKDDELPF